MPELYFSKGPVFCAYLCTLRGLIAWEKANMDGTRRRQHANP